MSATIDQTRLEAFLGTVANEVGAAMNTALVAIGDRLGLYRAMADAQPVSAAELAARTGTHERYVREWLNAQAAGGVVTYDPAAENCAAAAAVRRRAASDSARATPESPRASTDSATPAAAARARAISIEPAW